MNLLFCVIHHHHMGAAQGLPLRGVGSLPSRGCFPKSVDVPGRFSYYSPSDGESDGAQREARLGGAPCSRVAQKATSWRVAAVPCVIHNHCLPQAQRVHGDKNVCSKDE